MEMTMTTENKRDELDSMVQDREGRQSWAVQGTDSSKKCELRYRYVLGSSEGYRLWLRNKVMNMVPRP